MAMVRGTLTTAVYQKALQMDITASTSAKTLTLMSADCERITRGLMDLHELWANVIQVAFATWLIETQLGVAWVAPIAVTVSMFSPRLFRPLLAEELIVNQAFHSHNWPHCYRDHVYP